MVLFIGIHCNVFIILIRQDYIIQKGIYIFKRLIDLYILIYVHLEEFLKCKVSRKIAERTLTLFGPVV